MPIVLVVLWNFMIYHQMCPFHTAKHFVWVHINFRATSHLSITFQWKSFNSLLIRLALLFECLADIDECSSNPCQNGATCVDMIAYFTCNCKGGYNGTYCEIGEMCTYTEPCDALLLWFPRLNKRFCVYCKLNIGLFVFPYITPIS